MGYLATNNAYSTLAGTVAIGATSMTVQAGHGDRFPIIVSPDYTYVTLENSGGSREIVKVTARASAADTMTIVRAQDGTTDQGWSSGDLVELRICNIVLEDPTRLDVSTDVAAILAAVNTAAIQALVGGAGLNADTVDTYHGSVLLNTNLIPAATRMLFFQAAAPTSWTQVVTHNNKALRVVSGTGAGSGGATAFTSVFGAGKATGSTAADLAAHTHTFSATTNSDGSHAHTFVGISGAGASSRINSTTTTGSLASTDAAGAHTHTVSGTSASTGAGGGHTHTLSLDLQYVDVIICSKD